jgi:ATP-dependent helicase/nuclease subunit B
MAVRFILGRSGSGKTSYCIKALVDALLEPDGANPLILLVPEQASFQAERAIFADKRIAGYSRLHILSFDRLQFLLFGKNTARPELSRIGRVMAIHKVLRENSENLKIFDSSSSRIGLAAQMAQTITELQQYAESAEQIDRLLANLQENSPNSLTAMKFADIDVIRRRYAQFIEGKFIDPDIQFNRLRHTASQADFIKGASLWVDGFAGFTTSELAMLGELLKASSQAHIALCLDPAEINLTSPRIEDIDPAALFNPIQRTYAELVGIIKANKLKLVDPIILKKPLRFSQCLSLEHIERNVFKDPPAKLTAADDVRILSAVNKRAEVAFVAEEIQRLVKTKNLRYRDIAAIASDIESYQHYVKVCFDDYKIPFFIDRRKALTQHPVVNLLCSALQVVSNDFHHSDIFAYLKNDLVPIERADVDLLENYCLAFGVNPAEWQSEKDWQFSDPQKDIFDSQRINEIRRKAVAPLLDLRDKLRMGNIDAAGFTRIIFDFLNRLGIREKVSEWIEQAIEQNDFTTVDEHQQFYSRFVDVFDELVEVFGTDKLSCEDYSSIINCAFSQLTLRFIPPSLDEVLVGSIERSRHPDLKAVFLIGATHREFPTPVNYDAILTDDDRLAAQSANFPLTAGTRQTLAQRQYLAYIAFTRPSQFLYVTYPLSDDAGSDMVRSQFVDNLQSLFEDLNEESVADGSMDVASVSNESELAELLAANLGKDGRNVALADSQLEPLLNSIGADEQLGRLGETVRFALDYDNFARLDKAVVSSLFKKRIDSSATKLSTFAACPYKYFAKYILELEPREEFKLEPLDIGRFYHLVLDKMLKRLNAMKKNFSDVDDRHLQRILSDCVSLVLQEDKFISNFANRRAHNRYIIESACAALENCVTAIAQIVRAGQFRPVESEFQFEKYEIPLAEGNTLVLSGKIDRLDIAKIGDKRIAAVFDYKRRPKSYSWQAFYYGLDMQLAIYMLAVRHAASKFAVEDVAGAFYMPVETEIKSADLDEITKEKFSYKAKGIFNGQYFQQLDREAISAGTKFYNFRVTKEGQPYSDYGRSGALRPDDFEKVMQFTQNKILQMSEEIISGKINVWPYRIGTEVACSKCEYKSVCRFDWQINEYHKLSPIGKTGVLESIGGTHA